MRIIEKPLVSIALCTYNGERFLKMQMDSLLSQDYENIEIVAVDDCSTDRTWSILRDYAAGDSRIRLYQNEQNIGYTRNFEKAISLCNGDHIALSDQDDIWETNKISLLKRSIGECIMVYHNSDFIDEQGKRIGRSTMASNWQMYEGESCLPLILTNCVSGHATLFKKELGKYIFPFAENAYHDWWIAYAAFNVGKVKFIDKVLVHYRQHKNTITDSLCLRNSENRPQKISNREMLFLNVDWLKYCARFKYNKESGLVKKACTLLSDLVQGRSKFRAFLFMVKYFDLLFYNITRKKRGFLSKVNFARKICFD